ncbi:hypothetical protein OG216_08915 [Streptomycetaceae bacterium NBC_01309]
MATAPAGAASLTARLATLDSVSTSITADPADPGNDPTPEESASAEAIRTGQEVVVDELTTETQSVVAKPDGTFAATQHAGPVRTRQNGTWANLDPTLVPSGNGGWRPKASTGQLTLSGGGTAPMAAMNSQGGQGLAVSWPTALPQPVIDGDAAVYPEVLPGVDLRVTATVVGGFTQVLVVKTEQAAANPQLAALQLGMDADGVTVSRRDNGALAAKTPDGAAVFTAPKAVMWDSTTNPPAPAANKAPATQAADEPAPPADEVASDADGPGAYAKVADIGVAPAADQLTLTPDAGFLAADDTVFPVYIDPSWNQVWTATEHWTWVQEGCPDVENFDDYANQYDMGVGLQRWSVCNGRERTFAQVDSFNPTGKIVNFATFNAIQSYAADWTCATTHGVDLNYTGPINQTITWNNQPANIRYLGRAFTDSAGGAGCPNATNRIGWDITQLVRDEGWRDNLTFGMYGAEESQAGSNGFKRFTRKKVPAPHSLPFLYVEYDTPPNTPTDTRMNPEPQNPFPGSCGWIGATNAATGVEFNAVVTDPDPGQLLDAQFRLWDIGVEPDVLAWESAWVPNPRVASGSRIGVQSPVLLDGHTYTWFAHAGDGTTSSDVFHGQAGWAQDCTFSVDTTPPSAPVVTSPDWPASGSGTAPTKYAGQTGTFSFTATDTGSGLDAIEYSFNGPLPTVGARSVRDGADGAEDNTVKLQNFRVDTWGTNYLQVRAVDAAGNRSQPTTYVFYAPYDPNTKIVLGDITRDGYPDLAVPDTTGNLRIYPRNAPPAQAGTVASTKANGPNDPADLTNDSKRTWTGVLTSHRGGVGMPDDDLWAYRPGTAQAPSTNLYLYVNTMESGGPSAYNGQYFTTESQQRHLVERPNPSGCLIAGTGQSCGAAYAADWSRVKQILAIGDVDGNGTDRNAYDLLTIEDDGTGNDANLFLFHGMGVGVLDNPVLVDSAIDWRNTTLAAPGDVNGDGMPDLWARNTVTGDLVQYQLTRTGNAFTLGAPTTIRTGLTAAAYPTVSSDGDLYGDTAPDLWGVTAGGETLIWPGRGTGTALRFLAPVSPVAGALRLEAEDLPRTGNLSRATCCGTTWSGNAFAFLENGGASGTVTVTVPKEGDYRIDRTLTAGPDYGHLETRLDGVLFGHQVDTYSPAVTTRPDTLGTAHLTAGTHTLTFAVIGKNPAATGTRGGIDTILITPATDGVNLVADPGFETQAHNSLHPYFAGGRAGVDINLGGAPRTGTSNGWIHPDTPGWANLAQSVFIRPNTTYKLTAWIQTANNNSAYFGARKWGGGTIAETKLPTTPTGYTKYELTFTTDTDRLEIYAGTWNEGTAPWIRIDDITLQPTT